MTSNDSGAGLRAKTEKIKLAREDIRAKIELAKRRYEARVRARRRLCPHLSKAAHSANDDKNGIANTASSDTRDSANCSVQSVAKDTAKESVAKGNTNSIVKSAANGTAKGSANTTNSPTDTAANSVVNDNTNGAKGTAQSAAKDPTKMPFMLENPRLSKGELCPALAKFELLLWDKFLFYEKCLLEEDYIASQFWHPRIGKSDFPRAQLAAYEKINADDVWVEATPSFTILCDYFNGARGLLTNTHSTAKAQLEVIGKVIDAIYSLENACFRTHESLARLAKAISALDNFEQNAVKPILHSFNRGMIYSTPVYERISRYYSKGYVPMSVEYDCTYKYELKHCDSSILEQIKVLKRHLRECQAWADASTAWLDECISRQDFEPREVLDNFVAPEPIKAHFDFAMSEDERREVIAQLAKKRAVIKRADYAKLADDEKKRLDEIIIKAKEIQRLIAGDFVKDGKWIDTKSLMAGACEAGGGPLWFFRALGLD